MTDLVKHTISQLSTFDDEQLVHYYKCALSKKLSSEKKLYAPLIAAIEKERRSRGAEAKVSAIVKPKVGSASDMYENEN